MTLAIVLGSAQGVFQEVAEAMRLCQPDMIIAVNDMIPAWPDALHAAVSFHAEKMRHWLRRRQMNGYSIPQGVVIPSEWPEWYQVLHKDKLDFEPTLQTPYRFDGQDESGSSGLFAVKVALVDYGVDRVICCGMPMEPDVRYQHRHRRWYSAIRHRKGWEQSREQLRNVRSMSGWTADFLGRPSRQWCLR